ncbi:RnfH family protein [Niveibacterium umoris]|uniref:UPF0125 protein GGR36_000813 n=1 Tax=Niveibacterium umoris TaxID=1193620 RepID=A0A840BEF5_9RHOO|nr:RnfH family protein [Niveibacterium umoris]MBB4011505.1 hypothetical protein [Niveibacterium umoris]
MHVEVVYARPHKADVISLALPEGSSIQQAIDASGMLQKHPEIDRSNLKVGVFGKLSKPDTVLKDRDRVEIYRPLLADPKEVRRKRAEDGKLMKKGGGEA